MFSRTLVPVDLTEKNVQAIQMACDLASDSGAVVILLHVIETLEVPFEELKDFYGRLEEKARREMDEMGDRLREWKIEFNQELRYGKRAEEIVRFTQDEKIDLVILSSHRVDPENPGTTWTTISYQVAILAQCPVLLVK